MTSRIKFRRDAAIFSGDDRFVENPFRRARKTPKGVIQKRKSILIGLINWFRGWKFFLSFSPSEITTSIIGTIFTIIKGPNKWTEEEEYSNRAYLCQKPSSLDKVLLAIQYKTPWHWAWLTTCSCIQI
jgi:hypothetical protein